MAQWLGHPFGMRRTQSPIFSLPSSEQRFDPRTPTYQKGIPRLRNTQTFVSPVFPVKHMWYKILAYSVEAPLEGMLPASHRSAGTARVERKLCPSQPAGTVWAQGSSFHQSHGRLGAKRTEHPGLRALSRGICRSALQLPACLPACAFFHWTPQRGDSEG